MANLDKVFEKIYWFAPNEKSIDWRLNQFGKLRKNREILDKNNPDDIFTQYNLITSLIHFKRLQKYIKADKYDSNFDDLRIEFEVTNGQLEYSTLEKE